MRRGFVSKNADGSFNVGAEDLKTNYRGPTALVYADETWLHIVTCRYEGAVMLNIEALPALKRALNEITNRRKAKK